MSTQSVTDSSGASSGVSPVIDRRSEETSTPDSDRVSNASGAVLRTSTPTSLPGSSLRLIGSNSYPPGGSSSKLAPGAPGGGKGDPHIIIQNIITCCNLQTTDWLKIFSAIALIVSIALVAFLACYTTGLFHFEKFIGPIGSSVSLSGAGLLVLLSGSLFYLSFRR